MRAADSELTVVIPAHRAAATIGRTLESVLEQTRLRPEVVVVVDGADEEMMSLLAEYPVTVLVNQEPKGSQQSRNRGLAAVRTEYVTFLDSDDYLRGELHHEMVHAMQSTGADMVFAPWTFDSRPAFDDLHSRRDFAELGSRDRLLVAWAEGAVSKTGAMAWRTEALRCIGGWDAALSRYQDVEIGLRSLACGLSYCFTSEGELVYVLHQAGHRVTAKAWDSSAFERYFALLEQTARRHPASEAMGAAISRWSYRLATTAFQTGNRESGRALLEIARRNGRLPAGTTFAGRLVTRLLGHEHKLAMTNWIRARPHRS